MIAVLAAPPSLTVQDEGREGYRALGVPPSGSADRQAAHALNEILGNEPGAALLEWAAGGGALRFDAPLVIAVGGATVEGTLDRGPLVPYAALRVRAGSTLRIVRLTGGRFLYLAVRGGLDVPLVLGSRSTLASARLGGYEGRRLRAGDVIRVRYEDATVAPRGGGIIPGHGAVPAPEAPYPPREAAHRPRAQSEVTHRPHAQSEVTHRPSAERAEEARSASDGALDRASIPLLAGPHLGRLPPGTLHALLAAEWRVSHAADRAGVRLTGPLLESTTAAWPSEPTCVGAVQLPPDGQPIVLMPDGPTVGGYPIVAVVPRVAMSRFAQRAPGSIVRFEEG